MNENTGVQRALHKNLVCDKFEEIIAVAEDFHALGCKVNGAGGDGGSIAILTNGDMVGREKCRSCLSGKDSRQFQFIFRGAACGSGRVLPI